MSVFTDEWIIFGKIPTLGSAEWFSSLFPKMFKGYYTYCRPPEYLLNGDRMTRSSQDYPIKLADKKFNPHVIMVIFSHSPSSAANDDSPFELPPLCRAVTNRFRNFLIMMRIVMRQPGQVVRFDPLSFWKKYFVCLEHYSKIQEAINIFYEISTC